MRPSRYRSRSDGLRVPTGSGFTLIELMITITIFAILMATAAPSLIDVVLGNKLSAYANSLVASTLTARSEAIKRNAVITLCVSTDGATCATTGGWEQGWIVMCNSNISSNVCNTAGTSTIVIQRQPTAASGLKITEASSLRTLSFDPTGVGTTAATLTVCRATPSAGRMERVVTISVSGRPSVAKTTAGVCT